MYKFSCLIGSSSFLFCCEISKMDLSTVYPYSGLPLIKKFVPVVTSGPNLVLLVLLMSDPAKVLTSIMERGAIHVVHLGSLEGSWTQEVAVEIKSCSFTASSWDFCNYL